jgi:peptidoglycan/LPS O-acetylase OafA/YrhL
LLLQDVFHVEAFSAGVWYVAIDFQLFAMALLCAFLACKWQSFSNQGSVKQKLLVLWLTLSIISSLIWNLNAKGDMWGTYFFGAYGLGLCVGIWREAVPKVRYRYLIFGIVVLGVLATLQQARVRLGVAMVTACLLSIYEARGCPSMPIIQWKWVQQLSNASYSIFLIHFGVSLCVSAVVFNFWPENIPLNLAGMLTSFGISVALGQLIHRVVEKQEPTWRRVWQWVATFVATCAAVMLVG